MSRELRELKVVHQSGEPVAEPGIYAVVGIEVDDDDWDEDSERIHKFYTDELFPDYKGWAVCWRFVRPVEPKSEAPVSGPVQSITMPWQCV